MSRIWFIVRNIRAHDTIHFSKRINTVCACDREKVFFFSFSATSNRFLNFRFWKFSIFFLFLLRRSSIKKKFRRLNSVEKGRALTHKVQYDTRTWKQIECLLYQLSDTKKAKEKKNLKYIFNWFEYINSSNNNNDNSETPESDFAASQSWVSVYSVMCVRARQWMWYNCVSIALRHQHYSPSRSWTILLLLLLLLGESLWITHMFGAPSRLTDIFRPRSSSSRNEKRVLLQRHQTK